MKEREVERDEGRERKRATATKAGTIIWDGDRKRAPVLRLAVPMIWDNFSIFRTNCAIPCGTSAYMLRRFLGM